MNDLIEKVLKCNWIEDNDGEGGNYSTSCDQKFTFIEGGPSDNGMKYCCYCGFRLHEACQHKRVRPDSIGTCIDCGHTEVNLQEYDETTKN